MALSIFLVAALNLDEQLIQPDPICLQSQTPLMTAISTLNEIAAQWVSLLAKETTNRYIT